MKEGIKPLWYVDPNSSNYSLIYHILTGRWYQYLSVCVFVSLCVCNLCGNREDPANANGGVWVLRISKEDTTYVWGELAMAAIGEQFAPVLVGYTSSHSSTLEYLHDDGWILIETRANVCARVCVCVGISSDEDDICGITISVRGADNIVYVWNRNAHGRKNAILDKIRALLPSATIRNAFYKPSQAHDAFGKYARCPPHKLSLLCASPYLIH